MTCLRCLFSLSLFFLHSSVQQENPHLCFKSGRERDCSGKQNSFDRPNMKGKMLNLRQQRCSKCLGGSRESIQCLFVLATGYNFASWFSFNPKSPNGPTAQSCKSLAFACNGATFSALFETQQFPPAALVHKHVKQLRYVSVQVTFGPERLQGAFVKGRPIFRLGGQVSHGLSSRWLEWGHDVVMGGGQQACACVCVETSEQLLCGRWNTSEAEPRCFFLQLKVSFHTAEAFCCGILQVTASGLICLSMKEMDCYNGPQEIRG